MDGSGTGVRRKARWSTPLLLPQPTICPASLMADASSSVQPEAESTSAFKSTIDPLLQIAVGLEILEPFSIADELLSDPDIERRVALNPVLSSARKVGCLRNGFAAFANRMDELTSEDHDVD